MIVVFGGLTLLLRDEMFIKREADGALLAVRRGAGRSQLFFRRNLIRMMLGAQLRMPGPVWTKLNLSWAAFFAFMGAANLYVALTFPTDTWVNYKLFGGMGLMLLFMVAQALFLYRYIDDGSEEPKQ